MLVPIWAEVLTIVTASNAGNYARTLSAYEYREAAREVIRRQNLEYIVSD